jgi:hypothetical protein
MCLSAMRGVGVLTRISDNRTLKVKVFPLLWLTLLVLHTLALLGFGLELLIVLSLCVGCLVVQFALSCSFRLIYVFHLCCVGIVYSMCYHFQLCCVASLDTFLVL